MSRRAPLDYEINNPLRTNKYSFSKIFKDLPLFISLLTILGFGLFMLYSASGQSTAMVSRQLIYILFGLILMLLVAQLKPESYKNILGETAANFNTSQFSGPLKVGSGDTTSPNGSLPEGNVSMDQIMGLMNSK